jgi:hypothetical protein
MLSSKQTKTTKNNTVYLPNANILVAKLATAYQSNKPTCVDYCPLVLVILRKGSTLHKTCSNYKII